jgi:protein involved in ribonucleotide reduction
MIIAYDSLTGNVERFVQKLNMEAVRIQENLLLNGPFVLITYTTGFGQVPAKVYTFLRNNHAGLCGISASGNRNWGASFARSADLISDEFNVPVISKFELSGTTSDIEEFKKGVFHIATCRAEQ